MEQVKANLGEKSGLKGEEARLERQVTQLSANLDECQNGIQIVNRKDLAEVSSYGMPVYEFESTIHL